MWMHTPTWRAFLFSIAQLADVVHFNGGASHTKMVGHYVQLDRMMVQSTEYEIIISCLQGL